ncbi:MAG: alpha/beta hydrolase [Synergistaceae bacterium]|nr:alpha/beta hydrolase [Synergistaceae bacterium]MBR0257605.1 alpha/beta hydrolase [Synergistaceae bacterium]
MLRPELKQYLAEKPGRVINLETLPALRKALTVPPEALPTNERVNVRNEIIGSNLRVRVYTPQTAMKEYPALLWIHGGGHIMGTPEGNEDLSLRIADELGFIVVAPDYRLSPEHPYPAGLEDCYAALVWMTENLPVRKDRVAVAGQSAGGGLTAAVVLLARDKKYPAIHFQMPLYPMLDYRNIMPSSYQINDPRAWGRDFNVFAWNLYLGGVNADVPAYASPSMAKDLSGLPPAYIMVGTLDPFRDEDIEYAQRLMEAGVPVELHVIPGATHGFEAIFTEAEFSVKAMNEYVNALKEAMK